MILKRFWKLIALSLVIIAVLVTYFVHTSLVVANQFPDLVLKTIAGDESVMKDVIVYGDYYDTSNNSNNSSAVMVSKEDSFFSSEQSFFERLESQFSINAVSKLKDDHRNFMRGKSGNPDYFFESDEYLVYVAAKTTSSRIHYVENPDYYFEIDVWNKGTKQSTSYEKKLPRKGNYYSSEVLEVQVVNGELKVLTSSSYYGDAGRHVYEQMVYTIDLATHEISADDTLLTREDDDDADAVNWTDFTLLDDRDDLSEQKYFLFQEDQNRREVQEVEDGNEVRVDEVNVTERSFYLYDLESKQLKEITFTEEEASELLGASTWGFVHGTKAYIAYSVEGQLTILELNVADATVKREVTFNIDELGIQHIGHVKIVDDKLYVIDNYKDQLDPAHVFVGDVKTGEVLYEAEIVMENPNDDNETYELNFYHIVMK